jgi:hypothetical protein
MEGSGGPRSELGQQRPGFEPHQPVWRSLGASTVVRLTCGSTVEVCWDVQAYAHRL